MSEPPSPAGDAAPRPAPLAVLLEGGGARAAWQVGALCGLADALPDLRPRIWTGVSAGAINAAHLANFEGTLRAATADLAKLWGGLTLDQVFEARGAALVWRAVRAGLRLATGFPRGGEPFLGMVDTRPLARTLARGLGTSDGRLHGLRRRLAAGELDAVALIATRYSTGQTVAFFEGGDVQAWQRPKRRGVRTELSVEHVLASAALPLFFPPVRVMQDGQGGDWYGDGGVRLVAPLAPTVHLGAGRVLALSTRYASSAEEASRPVTRHPPSPALIAGNLYDAIFLDQLEQDALHLDRINALLRAVPEGERAPRHPYLRPVDLCVLRPSHDLGRMVGSHELDLPWVFRRLTRNLGTGEAESQDFLSTVMFEPGYVGDLLRLGREDGRREAARVAETLGLGAPV